MKKIFMTKPLAIILAVVVLLTSVSVVFAHPGPQAGILEQTYHQIGYKGPIPAYDYCIGGEAVGWCAYEKAHTNGSFMTYSVNDGVDDSTKNIISIAANQWSSVVTFHQMDVGGVGLIIMDDELPDNVAAAAKHYNVAPDGHTYDWEIGLKPEVSMTPKIIAHEFGHIIGLTDLYTTENRNKLMYYKDTEGTATAPAALDIWGAKVITGQHTSHTWGYKYYDTTASGSNRHVNYCTVCNGYPAQKTIANCMYNANNVCRICGTPAGYQPWSTPHEAQ